METKKLLVFFIFELPSIKFPPQASEATLLQSPSVLASLAPQIRPRGFGTTAQGRSGRQPFCPTCLRNGKMSALETAPLGNPSVLPTTVGSGNLFYCRDCRQLHSLQSLAAEGMTGAPPEFDAGAAPGPPQMNGSAGAVRAETRHTFTEHGGAAAGPKTGDPVNKFGGVSPHSSSAPRDLGFDRIASPKKIVRELNNYVVGQHHAKRVLAVAVHNHYVRVQSEIRKRRAQQNQQARCL